VSNSAIGQLTTGDSASGERTKHETSDLIGATQQGLSAIKRTLSNEEKATKGQIHNYLKQAQQALENGDADGAHLLATKAKVLLDELMKP
jgi:ribosomal protein S20